jgi:isocitrate dehydrogenase
VAELDGAQGSPVDVGGYYHPDPDRALAAMRPSATLDEALATLAASQDAASVRPR